MASITKSLRQKGSITITNHSISFQGTVIPIRNIARLTSFEISRKRKEALIYGACAVVAFAGGAVAYFYGLNIVAMAIAGVGVVFTALSAYSVLFKRYGLHIETSAGSKDFLVSKNKKFAEEILGVLAISKASNPNLLQAIPVSHTGSCG